MPNSHGRITLVQTLKIGGFFAHLSSIVCCSSPLKAWLCAENATNRLQKCLVIIFTLLNIGLIKTSSWCGLKGLPKTSEAGAQDATESWRRYAIAREHLGYVTDCAFPIMLPRRWKLNILNKLHFHQRICFQDEIWALRSAVKFVSKSTITWSKNKNL